MKPAALRPRGLGRPGKSGGTAAGERERRLREGGKAPGHGCAARAGAPGARSEAPAGRQRGRARRPLRAARPGLTPSAAESAPAASPRSPPAASGYAAAVSAHLINKAWQAAGPAAIHHAGRRAGGRGAGRAGAGARDSGAGGLRGGEPVPGRRPGAPGGRADCVQGPPIDPCGSQTAFFYQQRLASTSESWCL